MTEPSGPSSRWPKPVPQDHNVNLNVGFQGKPPKPPKQHRVRDIGWIIIASLLIAAATGSSIWFAIVLGCGVILYVVGNVNHGRKS